MTNPYQLWFGQERIGMKSYRKSSRHYEARSNQSCLNNVISLRVTDMEMEELEKVLSGSNKRISDLMREALTNWIKIKSGSAQQ